MKPSPAWSVPRFFDASDRDFQEGLISLTRDLCIPRTGVVADGNRELFERVSAEVPLRILSFPSGAELEGWVIPDNWAVESFRVFQNGTEVFDGAAQSLSVGYYSNSYSGELSLDELRQHTTSDPSLPSATVFHCQWQYQPWAADWHVSIPDAILRRLQPGRIQVELTTRKWPGEMLVGVAEVPGRSQEVIAFNSNNCHPHMANDGFAGTAVLIRLMQWLSERDNHYTYRLVIAPEHVGSVFYLGSLSQEERAAIRACLFEEMPGTSGALKAASTFLGNTSLDKAVANALTSFASDHVLVPWRAGAGNDETVWEAPGYEIPCVELTRCEDQFAPYPEYHTSADTWELMDPEKMTETLEVLAQTVRILEEDVIITRKFDGLPALSNPRYDLYIDRPDPSRPDIQSLEESGWGRLQDSLLRLMDGSWSVLDIAHEFGVPFVQLRRYIERFAEVDLVELTRAPIRHGGRPTP